MTTDVSCFTKAFLTLRLLTLRAYIDGLKVDSKSAVVSLGFEVVWCEEELLFASNGLSFSSRSNNVDKSFSSDNVIAYDIPRSFAPCLRPAEMGEHDRERYCLS